MSRCIFFYMPHMYAGTLRFHYWITSHPSHCASPSASQTHTRIYLLSFGHQCLFSNNEYCFCLCEHMTFWSWFQRACLSVVDMSMCFVMCSNTVTVVMPFGMMREIHGCDRVPVWVCVRLCTAVVWVSASVNVHLCLQACLSVHSAVMKCSWTKHFGVLC